MTLRRTGLLRFTFLALALSAALLGPAAWAEAPDPIMERALTRARAVEAPDARAEMLLQVALAYQEMGRPEEATQVCREAVEAARQSDESPRLLRKAALAAVTAGLPELASEAAAQLTAPEAQVDLLLEIAGRLAEQDPEDPVMEDALLQAVQAAAGQAVQVRARWLTLAGRAYLAAGRLEDAARLFGDALSAVEEMSDAGIASDVSGTLALLYAQAGRPEDARAIAARIQRPAMKLRALLLCVGVALDQGDEDAATAAWREADAARSQLPAEQQVGALADMASSCVRQGHEELARRALRAAEDAIGAVQVARERATLAGQVAAGYGEMELWEEAARVARESEDSYNRHRYEVKGLLALAESGQTDQAFARLQKLDPSNARLVGQNTLKELIRLYLTVRPEAGLKEVSRLGPEEFRDLCVTTMAEAAVERGEYGAALSILKEMRFERASEQAARDLAVLALDQATAEQAPGALEMARKALKTLKTGSYQVALLARMGAAHLALGDTDQAAAVAQELQKLAGKWDSHQEQAEALLQASILLERLGRGSEANEVVAKAVATTQLITCASCRAAVVENGFADLHATGSAELFCHAVQALRVAYEKCDFSLNAVEWFPDIDEQQKRFLLQRALEGSLELRTAGAQIEALVLVAAAYAEAGLPPGEAEQALLARAPAAGALLAGDDLSVEELVAKLTEEGPATVRLALFTEPACDACRAVKGVLNSVKELLPTLDIQVELYDVTASAEAAALNKAICEQLGLPAARQLVVPAVFSARGGLVERDINQAALLRLVANARDLPSPAETYAFATDEVELSLVERYEALALPIVVLAGLADGVNPCAFTVIIFFLSYLAFIGKNRRQIVTAGLVYTAAVFVTYFAIGLALSEVIARAESFSELIGQVLRGGAALLLLGATVLSLQDAVRCLGGRMSELSLTLPDGLKSRIRLTISKRARLGLTVGTTLFLGALVALFEFPCTGQVYVPIILALRHLPQHFWGAVGWLLLYNLCFIAPLLGVFLLVLFGLTSEKLTALFRKHVAATKFGLAGVFFLLFLLTLALLLG